MNIEVYNKINEKDTKKVLNKLATKNQKQKFSALINMHKIRNEKHYDVYVIAAKIARGESVSSDELKYIREHAPGLLEDARKQVKANFETKQEKSVNEIENKSEKDSES
jgi:ABC-type phosphate/phosphonate transport system ATPase subunit